MGKIIVKIDQFLFDVQLVIHGQPPRDRYRDDPDNSITGAPGFAVQVGVNGLAWPAGQNQLESTEPAAPARVNI